MIRGGLLRLALARGGDVAVAHVLGTGIDPRGVDHGSGSVDRTPSSLLYQQSEGVMRTLRLAQEILFAQPLPSHRPDGDPLQNPARELRNPGQRLQVRLDHFGTGRVAVRWRKGELRKGRLDQLHAPLRVVRSKGTEQSNVTPLGEVVSHLPFLEDDDVQPGQSRSAGRFQADGTGADDCKIARGGKGVAPQLFPLTCQRRLSSRGSGSAMKRGTGMSPLPGRPYVFVRTRRHRTARSSWESAPERRPWRQDTGSCRRLKTPDGSPPPP